LKTLYCVIVKHGPGTTTTHSICPLDDRGVLMTEFRSQAEFKAVQNKACNPTCDYIVMAAVGSAELNPAPKYHIVPTESN
jgi:hypothetical protein